MNPIAVLYKSTYGCSQKYAQWLVEELSALRVEAELMDAAKTGAKKLVDFDTIVFIGGLYAGSVNGFSLIKENREKLKSKKLVLCSVGLSSPEDTDVIGEVHKKTLGKELCDVPAFYLPGSMDVNRLGFLHKNMMKLIFSQLKKQETLTSLERNILSCQQAPLDFSSRDSLASVTAHLTGRLQP